MRAICASVGRCERVTGSGARGLTSALGEHASTLMSATQTLVFTTNLTCKYYKAMIEIIGDDVEFFYDLCRFILTSRCWVSVF